MTKTEITSSVKAVGSNVYTKSSYYGQHKQPDKKAKHHKIRPGEIVQGTILSIDDEYIALVKLPIGQFYAELHSKLLRGDSLFFKVVSTEPSLVLSTYSINSVKYNKPIEISEVIRILDLPDTDFFKTVTRIIRKHKNTINRDEILLMSKFSKFTVLFDNNNLLFYETIFWLKEASIPINESNLRNFQIVFKKLGEIQTLFDDFIEEVSQKNIMEIEEVINTLHLNKNNLLSIFSLFGKGENSILSKLKSLDNIDLSKNGDLIIQLLDSTIDYSKAAINNFSPASIILLLPYNQRLHCVRLIVEINSRNSYNDIIKAGSLADYISNNISYTLDWQRSSLDEYFTDIANYLLKEFSNLNLAIHAFFIIKDTKEVDIMPQTPHTINKNFSVVI